MSMNKKPLSRDDVLGAQDIDIEEIEVPEWGGTVFVKGMTGKEREQFEKGYSDTKGNIRAKLVSMTICDKDGVLLFSLEDVEKLGSKSASALIRIFDVARRLSRIGKDENENISEEMETNPSGDSASD